MEAKCKHCGEYYRIPTLNPLRCTLCGEWNTSSLETKSEEIKDEDIE